MPERNGLITHGGTRRHPRPARSAAVRLHDLSRTCARRQRRSLYRRARTAHLRGRAYSGRGFSRPAGRILRSKHRASLHDACDRAARGRVRPSRHRRGQPGRALFSIGTPMWATRFWWMLKSLGFDNVAVLDGGFDKWKAEGRAIETGPAKGYPPATFTAKPQAGYFVGKHEVLAASSDRNTVVVNALGPQFHKGLEPSRYGRPGRIPGSFNVSAATLLDPADQGLRAARGRRSEIRGARHHARTSAWSPIAAAASRPPSTCSCCTGSATTTSRSMTARWANGPRMSRCRSRRVRRSARRHLRMRAISSRDSSWKSWIARDDPQQ